MRNVLVQTLTAAILADFSRAWDIVEICSETLEKHAFLGNFAHGKYLRDSRRLFAFHIITVHNYEIN